MEWVWAAALLAGVLAAKAGERVPVPVEVGVEEDEDA